MNSDNRTILYILTAMGIANVAVTIGLMSKLLPMAF